MTPHRADSLTDSLLKDTVLQDWFQPMEHAEHQAGGWDEDEEPPEVKRYDAYRAFYAQLSKITRQVWRFLKNCFREKSSLTLYQRQLKPLLQGYL